MSLGARTVFYLFVQSTCSMLEVRLHSWPGRGLAARGYPVRSKPRLRIALALCNVFPVAYGRTNALIAGEPSGEIRLRWSLTLSGHGLGGKLWGKFQEPS